MNKRCQVECLAPHSRSAIAMQAAAILAKEFFFESTDELEANVTSENTARGYLEYNCPSGTILYALVDQDCATVVSAASVAHSCQGKTWIHEIATSPDLRGGGLGGVLLQGIIAGAHAAGDSTVILASRQAAIPFYERHGFEAESRNGMTVMKADVARLVNQRS